MRIEKERLINFQSSLFFRDRLCMRCWECEPLFFETVLSDEFDEAAAAEGFLFEPSIFLFGDD